MSEIDFEKVKGFTEQEYKQAKTQFGSVYVIGIDVTQDEHHDYLSRKPGREIMMAVAEYGRKENFEKANEVLIKGCIVAGDMRLIEEDFAVYSALIENLSKLTKAVSSSFRKA